MFNLRSLDLNLLTVFEAIYELSTVSAAADRLALSQSATSHALSRLRDACGDELFVRAGQGLIPTPTAQAMYSSIKQALEALRATLAEASGFDPAQSQRRFRIIIPHPMGPFYALALRGAAAAVAPRVVLTFDTVSGPLNLEENLRDGVFDLAVDWLSIELGPFVNKKLFDDRLVLISRRGHPLANEDVTIEDLQKAELVAPNRRRDAQHLPQALRDFYKLEVPEATDLLGIFPSSMAPLLQKLGLRILAIPLELPPLPIYIIWHETRRNEAAHRWLRDFVVGEMSRFGSG